MPLIALVTAIVATLIVLVVSLFDHNAITGTAELETVAGYPYKKHFMTDTEVRERFERLKKYRLEFAKNPAEYRILNTKDTVPGCMLLYRGKPEIVMMHPDGYEKYDNISDYFQEEVRVQCKRYDQKITPYQYWQQNRSHVRGSIKEQREYLYEKYYECTTFKPSLLVGFVRYFGNTNVVDVSSGWGDRLIGALACVDSYSGSDPNKNLQEGYNRIIEFFGGDKQKFRVQPTTFQDAQVPNDATLVFTSPPYFDLEEYSGVKVKDTLDVWLSDFLEVSLRKAAASLVIGGHMVININDSKDVNFCHRMLKFNIADTVYLGCIGQAQFAGNVPKSVQPFWVWKKVQLPTQLNPPVVIKDYEHSGCAFRVISDDLLLGGSKQRIMMDVFKAHPEGVVYPGPSNGYAQIALSLAAKLSNSRTILLLPKVRPILPQTVLAMQLGGDVREYEGESGKLSNLRQVAEEIAIAEGMYLPKLGFEGDEFNTLMTSALETSLTLDRNEPYTIWVAGGSGTLGLLLQKLFPKSHVHVVQVGKPIDWHFKGVERTTLHVAPERLSQPAAVTPPYLSLDTYDAKVWQFAKTYMEGLGKAKKEKILIWNVAGFVNVF
jgi:hypothetical protein